MIHGYNCTVNVKNSTLEISLWVQLHWFNTMYILMKVGPSTEFLGQDFWRTLYIETEITIPIIHEEFRTIFKYISGDPIPNTIHNITSIYTFRHIYNFNKVYNTIDVIIIPKKPAQIDKYLKLQSKNIRYTLNMTRVIFQI